MNINNQEIHTMDCYSYTSSKNRFLSDVKDHRITILKDCDVYRHIKFQNPDSCAYGFDLITWPGILVIQGDMGSYMFSRSHDMFNFFFDEQKKEQVINPAYWGEKLESIDKNSPLKIYNRDNAVQEVTKYIQEWGNNFFDYLNEENKKEEIEKIIKDFKDDIVDVEQDRTLFIHYLYGYHYKQNYIFENFESYSIFDEYNFHYLWCCHAILWGIEKYKKKQLSLLVE